MRILNQMNVLSELERIQLFYLVKILHETCLQ